MKPLVNISSAYMCGRFDQNPHWSGQLAVGW
jgi:hypothetical protein